ncbi:MAG: M48 family metalloprotease, partial [Spirochaetes bacterium]|nr:M48 family metalloprotease [Spirochaetota bacterium]
ELEGVIAHEMAHVENRDIRLMLITVAGISFFTLLAEICFRSALVSRRSSGKDGDKGALILLAVGIIFMLYGYIIAPLIRLAVSRQREYLADSTAALTTRNPGALASALRKISGHSVTEELKDHASMAAMCIENPGVKQGVFAFLSNLTATHPPIEDRIRRLEAMDGRV